MQQNLYNVCRSHTSLSASPDLVCVQIAYDLAVPLAALGIAFDGNIHTDTLSIGKTPSCLGLGDSVGLWNHDTYSLRLMGLISLYSTSLMQVRGRHLVDEE